MTVDAASTADAAEGPLPRAESLFRIVRGRPSGDEIAVLTALLLTRGRDHRDAPSRPAPAAPPWGAGDLGRPYRSPASWQR
ncbi:acyl-CoA carboxylase epsilon subunit [Streptomyces monomycini]|uniref:acyl-CoA carboxylase epsilon subunit n=1 Tax=Streptomyces monomycini TaxID=371720 RepID=UPI0004A9FFD6|nr:acyl-CoA carboxylase epsilon subunit [Streptomyces monomycini]